jgi:protein SCO1
MKFGWKLLAGIGLGVAMVWAVQVRLHAVAEPAVMGTVTSTLSLQDKSGQKVTLSQLRGKVVVAAHYYSTCPMGCAVLAGEMHALFRTHRDLHPELQIVSFAIDPADTPERLAAFAKEAYEVERQDSRWWFVNGEQDAIRRCLVTDFKFNPVREKAAAEQTSPVDKYAHDMRIALLDREMQLRGLYNVMAAEPGQAKAEIARLNEDLIWLLEDD